MKYRLLLSICMWLFSYMLVAQPIEQMDFSELEAYMEERADTDTVYIYNFWATWCKPCVAELPHFEQLHQSYAKKNVRVVFVSLDFPNYAEALAAFVQKNALTAEVLWLVDADANTWISKVDPEWSGVIPSTLIVGPNQLRAFKEQSFTYEELTTWVDELIDVPLNNK